MLLLASHRIGLRRDVRVRYGTYVKFFAHCGGLQFFELVEQIVLALFGGVREEFLALSNIFLEIS